MNTTAINIDQVNGRLTASKLRYVLEENNPDSYFFSRETMASFGDTMSNFGCRLVKIRTHWEGDTYHADKWFYQEGVELYRRRPVKHGNTKSYLFNKYGRRMHGAEVV